MKIRDHISESERSRFLTVLVIWCVGDIQTTATQSTRTIEYWRHLVNYDVCVSPGTGDGWKVKTWTVAACPNQYLSCGCPIKRKEPVIVCSKGQRDMTNGSIWGANKYQGTQGDLSDEIHASSSLLDNMMSWLEFYWLCIRECLWNSTRDWQTTKFYDPWPSILFSLAASETDTSSFLTIHSWWTSLLPLSLITLPPFLF